MTRLDQFTLTTIPLEQYFNNTRLGQGTGFVWKVGEQHYLVTAWHVLSMRNFYTGENLKGHAGRPNILRTLFNTQTGSFAKQQWDIKIWDDDDKPFWLVHPQRRVDIAVLPLPPRPPELIVALYPLNVLANSKLRIEWMEVFILGYPFKIELPAYPVWKRGSIASEPQLVGLTTPYMLVDTASRPGMSGAPVIRRSWSGHLVEPGNLPQADMPLASSSGSIPAGYRRTVQTKPRSGLCGTAPLSTKSLPPT
jgi:hypothetical protein